MTVDMLSRTSGPDQFDSIFLNRIDYPCVRFDAVASLPMPGMVELDPGFRNGDQHPRMRYLQKLYATLKTGLGDRVKLIHITCPLKSTMSPSGTPENLERHINVGLLFNETNINRKTDRGPAPTDKRQAAAFRQFWGDIAELRRYPDGTITESVSWNSKASRTPIYQQIIRYAVERHFGSGRGETICFAEKPILPLLDQVEDGLSLFTLIQSEYETLEKDLQSLTGIPLALRHTAGTGAALRSAALNIPVDTRRYADPVDVIVQFESSGRWPDNIQAVQKIKISFLARLSSLLEQTKGGELACRLGLENQEHDMMNGTFLDVTYASGTTFRLRILHDREPALLENFISKPAASHREKQRARQALRVHRITFEMLPRHTQLIRKLCQRYPSMSPTIRLVKKWFHSHLLSSHVSDELVELFVARVYLNPYPWSSPCSASTALFRTIDFLARWDWRCDPLIIDLGDNSMTKADIQQCADVFREVRNKDPTMNNCAMFVATNYDLTDSLWTQSMPTKVIAGRITALAKTATQVLKDHPLNVNIYVSNKLASI